MNTANFIFDPDLIGLQFEGKYFDFHNNFSFLEMNHDLEGQQVRMVFTTNRGDWVPQYNPGRITWLFTQVSEVVCRDHDADYPAAYVVQDQSTLAMMGFCDSSHENMSGVAVGYPKEGFPAILFLFVTGKAIKIVAEKAEIVVAH